jgi:hypothetical protein
MKPDLHRFTPFLLLALAIAVVRLAYLWQTEKLQHEVDLRQAEAVLAQQQAQLLRAELLNRAYERAARNQGDNVQNVLGPLVDWLKKAKEVDLKGAQALFQENPTSLEGKTALLKLMVQFKDQWMVPLEPAMLRMSSATERLLAQQSEFEAERDRILALGRSTKSPSRPAK